MGPRDYPRVTRILEACGLGPDLSGVPPVVLEAARLRGLAVHAAIEADHYGWPAPEGPNDHLPPTHGQGYLDAYRRFLGDTGHEAIASELEVTHPTYRYRGHPDRVGWRGGQREIVDWKTGPTVDLPATARQVAAYRLAWNAQYVTAPVVGISCVQLRADGTYRLWDLEAAQGRAEEQFLAALTVWWARKEEARG